MIKILKDYSLIALGVIAVGIISLVVIKYLLPIFSPFIIAWIVAAITRVPAERISQRMRVPERVLRLMMSLLLITVIFGGISLIIWRLTGAAWR